MKRCCLERKTVLDLALSVAALYDGSEISTLSEKEAKFLNLFVDIGIGRWYDNIYKLNP